MFTIYINKSIQVLNLKITLGTRHLCGLIICVKSGWILYEYARIQQLPLSPDLCEHSSTSPHCCRSFYGNSYFVLNSIVVLTLSCSNLD